MLIYLDTEFTDLVNPELLSIGLVSECGREFYSEIADYRRGACSEFVRENVLPLLGHEPGAQCDRDELARRLRVWFSELPEPATIIFDFHGDWTLLLNVIQGPRLTPLPVNFGAPRLLDASIIGHPVFREAKNTVFFNEYQRHHSLDDAKALMAAHAIWRRYTEQKDGEPAL